MVKNIIRKSLFKQGQLLSKSDIEELDYNIQKNVLNEIDVKSSKNTLLYFPYKNEIAIDQILSELIKHSNNIYMPKIVSKNKLRFNIYQDGESLKKNKYGIKEAVNENYIDPKMLNTMFIPFVGVDKNGYRLGYGGGFFDRTLEKLKSEKDRPLFVGLGYDFQILDKCFGRSHDIKYDVVITESRVLSYN